jgi:hypothetical protein
LRALSIPEEGGVPGADCMMIVDAREEDIILRLEAEVAIAVVLFLRFRRHQAIVIIQVPGPNSTNM